MAMDDALVELLGKRRVGVLATIKRDGRPQLSNVSFTYDEAMTRIRVSTTDGRAKAANMRRDPRVSFHVSSKDGWSYVVAEGTASLSPVASDPRDATVQELIEIYRTISGGEHPDWDDYRAAMVRDRRLVLTIAVDRVYGLRQDS
jgi:PPOX class probable F420-dependent enzyme